MTNPAPVPPTDAPVSCPEGDCGFVTRYPGALANHKRGHMRQAGLDKTNLTRDEIIRHHAILFQCRYWLEQAGRIPLDACRDYDALNVTPVSVHHSKRRHVQAVRLLADCLQRGLHPDQHNHGRL